MAFDTDLPPVEVLHRLQEIEKSISPDSHRGPGGGYADRIIDIDIVAVDTLRLDTPELVVPHPHLGRRRFFLQPMEELAPGWRHPATGLTPAEMLEACPE